MERNEWNKGIPNDVWNWMAEVELVEIDDGDVDFISPDGNHQYSIDYLERTPVSFLRSHHMGAYGAIVSKVFEVRDRGTHVGVLATKMKSEHNSERYELRRAGYRQDNPLVVCMWLTDPNTATYTPEDWSFRMDHAHRYISKHFDELARGSVVDIEFILGETKEPKKSEQFDWRDV